MNKIIATDGLSRNSIGPNITFGNRVELAKVHMTRKGESETKILRPHFEMQRLEYLLTLQRSIPEQLDHTVLKYVFADNSVENWTTNAFLALLTPVVASKVSEESAILEQLESKLGRHSKETLKSFLLKKVCEFDGLHLGAVRKDKYEAVFKSRIQVLEQIEVTKLTQKELAAKMIAENVAELDALVTKPTVGPSSSLRTDMLKLQAIDLKSKKAQEELATAEAKIISVSLPVERSSVRILLGKSDEVHLSVKL